MSACGSNGGNGTTGSGSSSSSASTPQTASLTTNTPTSTVATPITKSFLGPNGVPMETGDFLAAATTTRLGAIVHGVQCEPLAQRAYMSYAHLQVYIDGHSRALPGGIGLVDEDPQKTPDGLYYSPLTCMYWLHTRAADGLVEVEAPVSRTFTLGDFFAVWDQRLTRTRITHFRGAVTAIVNGHRWRHSPAQIPLREHTTIQLSIGKPAPAFHRFDWAATNF